MIQVSIEVNDKTVTAEVEPRLTLLDFIRDVAGLKGTHAGCEHGVCGACTVLVEGNAIRSCLVLAVQADEQEVISIEGVGEEIDILDLGRVNLYRGPDGGQRRIIFRNGTGIVASLLGGLPGRARTF